MSDTARVAVYLDFDNVVISRYDSLHGSGSWRRDGAWKHTGDAESSDPIDVKLAEATVDIGSVIDYASGFGTVALTRAYADWSMPANAGYRRQLIDRAVDLVQLFANSGTKNGADIRLAVDALEDVFRHDDVSHVLVVAGDSDYVPLAQRCKRMGRYVVGIGVAGSTSAALVAACDEFTDYARLPGVPAIAPASAGEAAPRATRRKSRSRATSRETADLPDQDAAGRTHPEPDAEPDLDEDLALEAEEELEAESESEAPEQDAATSLLLRAMRVGAQKSDDEWIHSSSVKSQMQRMDPGFKEKSLGYTSFRAFVESRHQVLETKQLDNGQLLVKLV